jgi:hypothetical protein
MAATFSGLGERKDKIVGTIAEPRMQIFYHPGESGNLPL